jgi:polar amino acid transport system permease protein
VHHDVWDYDINSAPTLMKLSSLASGIGFAELTYQVRQIESYNAHALEAFTVGTLLYLLTGVALGLGLARIGPARKMRSRQVSPAKTTIGSETL